VAQAPNLRRHWFEIALATPTQGYQALGITFRTLVVVPPDRMKALLQQVRSSGCWRRLHQQLSGGVLKDRQVPLDNRPDCFHVDLEVAVHQDVPQTRNPSPIHLWMTHLARLRNALRRRSCGAACAVRRVSLPSWDKSSSPCAPRSANVVHAVITGRLVHWETRDGRSAPARLPARASSSARSSAISGWLSLCGFSHAVGETVWGRVGSGPVSRR